MGLAPDRDSNQSPAFEDVNLFTGDAALQDAMAGAVLSARAPELTAFGADWGSAKSFELGRLANENPPRFVPIDPRGERIDRVEFHRAYHALMGKSMAAGLHASTWEGAPQALRAAQLFMAYQVESGHICPITMTHAARNALAFEPELAEQWRPSIVSKLYDPRELPWRRKSAVTIGMAMTERQGGTDLRATAACARRHGDRYEITGDKWFMSAPMSDAFLTLAQAQGALTCFLLPRFTDEGAGNGIRLERLKDKLGDRSNASSEAAFMSASAQRVGPEGAGLRTILAMAQATRLDCAIASAGLMRFGLAHATHHARHRRAFGRPLIEQPAMRRLLADLALEVEANTALTMRLARAIDAAPESKTERAYARLLTPAAKFLVCKTAPGFLYECMECLGGNGYVEDFPLARAYRQAPVNAIWEGSSSVMALDVLRAAARSPDAAAQIIADLDEPAVTQGLVDELRQERSEACARRTSERLARAAALAALRAAQPALADAYRRTRCSEDAGSGWGARDLAGAQSTLIERILPV